MKRLLLLFLLTPFSLKSQPITGAFTTGTMNSTTTTTQTIVESVVSKDYNSGYSYSIAGTGIEINGTGNMVPSATQTTGTTDGVSYSWTGLDFSTKPSFEANRKRSRLSTKRTVFMGPGLSNVTTINRQITVESTQVTQSIFQR